MTRPESDAAKRLPISASQGARSSSSSGVPEAILSMFDCGCSESPSRNSAPRRSAMAAPTVLLPQLVTPITTMWRRAGPAAFSSPVFSSPVVAVLPVMDGAVDEAVVGQVGLLVGERGGGFFVEFDADAGLVARVQVAVDEGHGLFEDLVGFVRVLHVFLDAVVVDRQAHVQLRGEPDRGDVGGAVEAGLDLVLRGEVHDLLQRRNTAEVG